MTCVILNPDVQVSDIYTKISDKDFRVEWFSGTGNGGQHRNRHRNSCRLIHEPTGLMESRQGRKRDGNLQEAKAALLLLLKKAANGEVAGIQAADRKSQAGSGMRSDKSVTIRFQDDKAINHLTGRTMTATRYMKGYMSEIW